MMVDRVQSERGMALGLAIVALVVIGGLVSGALFVGVQEQRTGQNWLKTQQAAQAAEQGAQMRVAEWGPGHAYNDMTVGATLAFSDTLDDGTGWYRGTVQKLNDILYLVRSEGFSADDRTRQEVAVFVRLKMFELNINAALKTQGQTTVAGNSDVDGNDYQPTGWTCDAPGPAQPGIRIADASDVTIQGNATVDGDPPILEDTTQTTDSLLTFGDLTFDDLAAMATKVFSPGNYNGQGPVFNADGSCQYEAPLNWGDPLDPSSSCGSFFPIILFEGEGTTHLQTGVGQGILLVEGDLKLAGNFEFYGPVIVKGKLSTTGTGNKLNGGVIAANAEIDDNKVAGDATVHYSTCTVLKALQQNAPGELLSERSWVSLY